MTGLARARRPLVAALMAVGALTSALADEATENRERIIGNWERDT
ncbi:hypothetical protein [Roseomonas sp. KE2513]|nr:hypothetical protein [Roseomonas sp. KE2513]